jgi:hypothetical protein
VNAPMQNRNDGLIWYLDPRSNPVTSD